MREFEGETPLVQRIRGLMREREGGGKWRLRWRNRWGGEMWCLWRQLLISNKMPVMRSLFPLTFRLMSCAVWCRTETGNGTQGELKHPANSTVILHTSRSTFLNTHTHTHTTHKYTLACTFLVTDFKHTPCKMKEVIHTHLATCANLESCRLEIKTYTEEYYSTHRKMSYS